MSAFLALARGWTDLLRPAVLSVLLLGIALTVGLFVALQAAIFWAIRTFTPSLTLPFWGEISPGAALGWGSLALFPVMGFFLMAPVAAGFAGLFAERVAERVERIHYPARQGQSLDFWDALLESMAVIGAVLGVAVLSLLLTPFLGPLAPLLFFGANGWLLAREFFSLAARRHLSEVETEDLRRRHAGTILGLGVLVAVALAVPVANIVVPVLAAASFTHLFHRLAPGPRLSSG